MVSINPADGPIPKPAKKVKNPRPLGRGGRKPKEAGRRYEKAFADKYGFQRQVGSGAFGVVDPLLLGDVKGEIGSRKLLLECKSWEKVSGRGEKVVSFPAALLDKIAKEAELLGRSPVFIYHIKNSTDEWAVVKFSWLYELIEDYERQIEELSNG